MSKNLVVIGSGGRTGTQFFGDLLSRVIDDCWSEHEPDILFGLTRRTLSQIGRFGLWHMTVGRLLGQTGVRVLGHRMLTGEIDEDVAFDRLRRSRRRYHGGIAENLVVESNGQWWYFAGRVHRIWPGAKTVIIIRDPRDWVRSWLNRGTRYDRSDWARVLPPGRLTPAKLGDAEWADRWSDMSSFAKLAWEWRTIYGAVEAALDAGPDIRMFRFEDIFAQDGSTLRDLAAFVADHGSRQYRVRDLDGLANTVKNASTGSMSGWLEWSDSQSQMLEELCGPLMRRYGYGQESQWLEKVRMTRS